MVTGGPEILRMQSITKRFSAVLANDDISIEVTAGEVRALLGENGAGKSTLMRILYGIYQPDSGRILIDGKAAEITSPRVAVNLGIGMVHQHFMLVPTLTTIENLILGIHNPREPLLDLRNARTRLEQLESEYELKVDPMARVAELSVGEQQRLEILKALFREARILILDEPSAVLAPQEVEQLFRMIRRLSAEGRAIIFISHKLEEVNEISQRVTVLRGGRVIGTLPTRDATPSQLAHMMLGRPISTGRLESSATIGKPVLAIDQLSCLSDRKTPALRGTSFTVHSGEIVGIAGVDGNGQRELAECIAGLRRPTAGHITISGSPVRGAVRDPKLLGFIPEDRRQSGLILDFNVAENMILRTFGMRPYLRRGILRWRTIIDHAWTLIRRFRIQVPSPWEFARSLSGGTQQRVVVARETELEPSLLLASQATRGLDVGAVEEVLNLLRKQRDRGAAVLFISTELSEILQLSDRILVMFKGQILGEVAPTPESVGQIGEMMMGRLSSEASAQLPVGG